eukprot:CAMPEP_0180188476 /NCGR_PEP_ID=MMETSP0986-20121125/44115_1 /TAXON_ID=697907 /ORGANISM="non described non described, Strain CCMP2293" /LENGTH=50 /DNA_ID=CAMNT_0022142705 /DNA_START=398 /DNA_END=550 /DNA_ORIENTATION=-
MSLMCLGALDRTAVAVSDGLACSSPVRSIRGASQLRVLRNILLNPAPSLE